MRRRNRHDSAFSATLSGITDLFGRTDAIDAKGGELDCRGKRCLITGGTSGLGKAVAVGLAQRGGAVTLACRSGFPEAGNSIKVLSGSDSIEMEFLDLSVLETVRSFCEKMKTEETVFDVVVLSAGIVAAGSRKTVDGFDEMFQVNFLANFILVNTLLENGSIGNTVFTGDERPAGAKLAVPRIVFVSSETHRTAAPVDFSSLGRYTDYGMADSLKGYGYTKLLLSVYAAQLGRLLAPGGVPEVSVHSLCPGPVNSNITREAPGWTKPLLTFIASIFFQKPGKAAVPVIYLCCSREIEGATGVYLHMKTLKSPSPQALDPEKGKLLWEGARQLLKEAMP